MSKLQARRRIFINRPIQGALILRVLTYWIFALVVQTLMVAFLSIISSSQDVHERAQEFWSGVSIAAVSSAFVLPLLILDIIRLSHRWVGPIHRLRTALQELAAGKPVAPIRFRDGDFWQELAADFNAAARRLNGDGNPKCPPASEEEIEALVS